MKLAGVAAALLTAGAAVANECPVTLPQNGIVCNESLCARPPDDGRLVFAPDGPGFVDRDGALGIKFAWVRKIRGELLVGGRRLDGEAPPARAYLCDGCYGDSGFQPTYLVFPTAGCWEITGGVGAARLAFVLQVELVGEGPPWRFAGLEQAWKVAEKPD